MGVHNKTTDNTNRTFIIKYRDAYRHVRGGELLVIVRLTDALETCRS